MKNVLIIGASGQDGSLMADYLLKNTSYRIYGGVRRLSVPNHINLEYALKNDRFSLTTIDLTDSSSIYEAVKKIQPNYLINLAANSFVGVSWDMPTQILDVNVGGVIRCLEAIRKYKPDCRFYSAGSSEEMGDVIYSPQDINHPIRPRSPYGASKASARHFVKVYRESYNLYAVHGILYNHEGIRRGEEFVSRKITMGVARIKMALERGEGFKPIELGNLNTKRDWSDSEDFVDGIWRMLNQESYNWNLGVEGSKKPWPDKIKATQYLSKRIKEYILSSGETHSIREFVELAFKEAGIEGKWFERGNYENDEAFFTILPYPVSTFDKTLVTINPKFYRPADVETLCGDSTPARNELGWIPKTTFPNLVSKMVKNDLNLIKKKLS